MKVALVTGADHGLGKSLVEALLKKNYVVYAGLHYSIENKDLPSDAELVHLDVQDDNEIQKAASFISQKHGQLDLLINNAGINKDTATNGKKELATQLKYLDRQVLTKMMEVNAIGPVMVAKYMVPLMLNPGCFIINISSNRASFEDKGEQGNYGYRASKVALNMFTRELVHDLPDNVSVFAVHPGLVKTPMNPNGEIQPDDAAQKILAILDSWDPSLNGCYLNNDGSLFPR